MFLDLNNSIAVSTDSKEISPFKLDGDGETVPEIKAGSAFTIRRNLFSCSGDKSIFLFVHGLIWYEKS